MKENIKWRSRYRDGLENCKDCDYGDINTSTNKHE